MKHVGILNYAPAQRSFLDNEFFLLLLPALITVIISFFVQRHSFNSDVGIIIHETNALLAGGNYATSFFETNPPMILYLTMPICFISVLFKINPLNIAYCYFSIIALLSVTTSYLLMKKLIRESSIRYITFISLLLIMFILPVDDFGEREHIAIMLVMPYLFATALALNQQPLARCPAFFIGLFAGIGFALKPYFLIPLCLVELYCIVQRHWIFGWVRTESLTILAVMVLYLLAICVFNPTYLHIVLPLVNHYYFPSIINDGKVIYGNKLYNFAVTTLIATFFFYKNNRYTTTIILISLMQIGFMGALIATRTDWYYHMMPAIAFSLLQITFCLATVVSSWINERRITFTPQLVAVMAIYFSYFLYVLSGKPVFSENLLINIKWLFILSLSTLATMMVQLNKKMTYLVLPAIAAILYCAGINTLPLEINLLSADGYYFLIFDFILAWVGMNLAISLLGLTTFNLHWIPTFQKILCFTFLVAIVYFYPLHRIYMKYIRENQNIILHNEVINYLQQFPTKGGVFCFTSNDPSICVPLSYYTAHEFSSRQPGFWWMRGLLKAPVTPSVIKDRDYLLNIVGEDLKITHPQWVIINPQDFQKFPANFSLLNFLSINKTFREEWSHYELKTTIPKETAHSHLVDYYIYGRKS